MVTGQPTGSRPGPVGDDRVNETGDEHRIGQIGTELCALGNGTGNNGRGGGGKNKLEEPGGKICPVMSGINAENTVVLRFSLFSILFLMCVLRNDSRGRRV